MRKVYLILIIVALAIILSIFFGVYELSLLYYEESKADRLADYILIPVFTIFLLFLITTGLVSSVRRKELNVGSFLKEIAQTLLVMAVAHFVFLRRIVSGIILFLNTILGDQNPVIIEGLVIDKKEISGKGAEYELEIEPNTKASNYLFDTKGTETKEYEINSGFKKKLLKGGLGLIYLKE